MGKGVWAGVAVVGVVGSALAAQPRAQLSGVPACLHDSAERQADKSRRDQAVALAKAIHQAQGAVAERTRRYVPLTQLRNLPPPPRHFDVRLYTDGTGYVVSIKDTLDPCKFGIFSDESGYVYENTPKTAPLLAGES